ncbi:TATA element modulatory factor 1 TATA binding-domain-containing protein [Boeremia exigua]|uniref:TATA element modulatory factor 1 TATA binding-domain-containing protein n=1 Tax=Boeremia exigua TaxID=749465 RepID=UPI001E8CC173|nr:TATA element modulatory factor 1 TATA binding-domain-containing protein [Boeremia exigua]KAH6615110.1 TATA element modulatory factor 1 TATA binding-domain-containing protein [Boeremia exigua]
MSGKNWWNSAISGLESRLDTILAEDGTPKPADAAAKPDGSEPAAVDKKLAVEQGGLSRNSSRSRPSSRLQERLAKAVTKGAENSRTSSDLGSRPDSPALRSPGIVAGADTGRSSIDSKAEDAVDAPTAAVEEETATAVDEHTNDTTKPSIEPPAPAASPPAALPPTPPVSEQPTSARMPTMTIPSIVTPQTSSPRHSIDSSPSRPSVDLSTPAEPELPSPQDPDVLATELSSLQQAHEETVRAHRDELNSHLERIDALQSKLTYLSQQLAASAKAASADSDATPQDKKLAEKDAQIAALMAEGQKLSKTEMKHMTTIKQLRAKGQEQNKEITTLKQRLAKAEKSITEQSERAKRAEASEKAAQEKLKIVDRIEKDINTIRAEREEANLTITELRRQLTETLSRADDAEKRVKAGALEAEKRVTASLQEDLENLRIEKKIAEDRAKKEIQASQEQARSKQEKANVTELELRGEIANLESKLELLRSRSEEATSSATGDSQAKLLRQIDTLQTQYSLASENWQGIETTLTSRVTALEKDRDETAKRESDIRRKAREINSKARRLEDELDSINERARALEQDLSEKQAAAQKLQSRLTAAEAAAQDAKADLEREKKVWEAESQQRLEEEKSRWQLETQQHNPLSVSTHLRADSPSISNRQRSPDPLGIWDRRAPRSTAARMDTTLSPIDRMLEDARRPSNPRQKSSPNTRTPEIGTPQRQNSIPSGLSSLNGSNMPYTPSIHTVDYDEPFDNMSSPHRTINDMISVSTVGAGPSVQLVERMSAAVRRLESEKATHKEEMARLAAQRDEAREEVVALMREVDEKRGHKKRVAELDRELGEVSARYETTLEMLGEKTERADELEADLVEVKKMYRELVSTMGRA